MKAIVMGAASGLGQAFSAALLEKGAEVCLADIDKEGGEKLVKTYRAHYGQKKAMFVRCDVTRERELRAAFYRAKRAFGGIDVVANNARVSEERLHNWQQVVDVDLNGIIRGTFVGIRYLRKDRGGSGGVIVNTVSGADLCRFSFGSVYSAAKQAAVGFTRGWAVSSLVPKIGVRFCAICPSLVDTDVVRLSDRALLDPARAEEFGAQVRNVAPENVTEGFMNLVEDETKNGSVLKVTRDGGFTYVYD